MMSRQHEKTYALARRHTSGGAQTVLVRDGLMRDVPPSVLPGGSVNGLLATGDWTVLDALLTDETAWVDLDESSLLAPVEPRQVIQAGANYREHVIELVAAGLTQDGTRTPDEARQFAARIMDDRAKNGEPYFFIGLPACVSGPFDPLTLPGYSDVHDWELELAIVVGREAFRVDKARAMEHVAGFTIVNDITTRDLVFRKDMKEIGTDWYRAKNAPGFLPTGPYLVPSHMIDPSDLTIRLDLNDQTMQNSRTSDLMFDIPSLVSAASQTMPLLPGDLLLTGSPSGNGQHWKRFLRDGDVMVGTIEGLGSQRVVCQAEVQ